MQIRYTGTTIKTVCMRELLSHIKDAFENDPVNALCTAVHRWTFCVAGSNDYAKDLISDIVNKFHGLTETAKLILTQSKADKNGLHTGLMFEIKTYRTFYEDDRLFSKEIPLVFLSFITWNKEGDIIKRLGLWETKLTQVLSSPVLNMNTINIEYKIYKECE